MSGIRLTLRHKPDQRLDLSRLTPDRLAGMSESDIAVLPVGTTREPLLAGDVFRITETDARDAVHIESVKGAQLDFIGASMTRGEILVDGDVGAHAGIGMAGGQLVIEGNCGPFAGSGMAGGSLRVLGNAGDFLGGPRPGEMAGMLGGMIIVTGRTGARAGDRMRRGVIAIGSDAGDHPGSRMIAGTLLIFGNCGALPGYLLKRGTIVLGGEAADWTPTFVDSGKIELTYLKMLGVALKNELPPAHLAPLRGEVRRLAGDMATLGKGEILRLQA